MAELPENSFDIIDPLPERASEGTGTTDAPHATSNCPLVQTLYEGPRLCSCCTNWVDYLPDNADSDTEDDEDLPLIVRHSVIRGEDSSRVSVHSIEVRDSAARDLLFPVFEGFDQVNPSINYLVFHAPFKPFFYRWSQFEAAFDACTEPRTKAILTQLHTIVKAELAEAFAIWEELVQNGVISYPYLWTIFQPGEILCDAPLTGTPRFYYLEELEELEQLTPNGSRRDRRIVAQYVGLRYSFGLISADFYVSPFQGTRKITDLPVFPARFLPDFQSVKEAVMARGRRFAALAGVHYKEYMSGAPGGDGATQTRRIVLDGKSGAFDRPRVHLGPLKGRKDMGCYTGGITQVPPDAPPVGGHISLRMKNRRRDRSRGSSSEGSPERDYPHGRRDRHRPPGRPPRPIDIHTLPEWRGSFGPDPELDEFHLLICADTVQGFCLQRREWGTFYQTPEGRALRMLG